MQITRSGSQPSRIGPAENFTGAVRVDSPFRGTAPARVGGAFVTFEPGARTAWHTHPLGQTLIVVSGCGWVQREGDAKEEIRPGDVVWIPAGEKHWHGATATTAMTHIAISEALDGRRRRVDGKGERRTVPGMTRRTECPALPALSSWSVSVRVHATRKPPQFKNAPDNPYSPPLINSA